MAPNNSYDPLQMGRVIQRLDDQDEELRELRADVKALLALAHQGKGSLWALISIGSVLSALVGWITTHLWKS